jgi:signal transduction histidine kinase/ActR/RegA family two-component response regulator
MNIQPAMRERALQVSRAAALFAMATGLAVLAGWLFELPALREMLAPHGITMKANTALALTSAGLSLGLMVPSAVGLRRAVGRALALLVFTIGALTLGEHLAGWNLGIDELLFREPRGELATTSPGRMGLYASVSFALLGGALLLLDRSSPGGRSVAQLLACAVMAIATLPLLGYLAGAVELFGIARFTGIAMQTAVTLLVVSTGVLLARPDLKPAAAIVADDAGGQLVRSALPPILVAPLLLAWAGARGQQRGWFDAPFASAVVLLSIIVLFAVIIVAVAIRLSAVDRRQKELVAQRELLLASERAARSEAERAAHLKDQFLATVSHEVRTPLNAILGWASLARDPQKDRRQTERALDIIIKNARLQAQLIDDLLDISRIVSGKLRLEPKQVDLAQVVRAAATAMAPEAEAKNITIAQELGAHAAPVQGDSGRLQQVVWNLLSNAVKFTSKGGQVSVSLTRKGESFEVAVVDSGAGIDPAFLPLVFERFRQADGSTTRRHGGLGLGLSIVRHLVELHGGTVTAESPGKDRGSTFRVTLPAAVSSDEAVETVSAPSSPLSTFRIDQASLSGVKILVVDDEPDARDALMSVLAGHGASMTCEGSVDAALNAIDRDKPDVLVSDVGMPDRDGYDLIREVRQRFDAKQLPAIALTAFVRSEDRAQALTSGFQLHVAKPVDPFEVTLAVASLVGRAGGPGA